MKDLPVYGQPKIFRKLAVCLCLLTFCVTKNTGAATSKPSSAKPANATGAKAAIPTAAKAANPTAAKLAPPASEESDDEESSEDEDLQVEADDKVELPAGDERVTEIDADEENLEDAESEESVIQAESTPPPEAPHTSSQPAPTHEVRRANPNQARQKTAVEEEEELQRKIIERKTRGESRDSSQLVKNRFPETKPLFKLPPGPKNGGTVQMSHPAAKQGLVSISSDGIYQYKTKIKERTQSSTFKVSMMTPPTIDSGNSAITYESMYGNSNIVALKFEYEWEPFKSDRNWGLKMGTGIAIASGQGFFKNSSPNRSQTRSEEKYSLYMVPVSAMASYRFEYSRRQWLVPYVMGGLEGYGLAEIRSDNAKNNFAWSAAAGGGGGLLFPISRIDKQQAFTMSQEYGISDMWLSIEGIYMQGLVSEVDFTNQQINLGVQVDF